MSFTVDDYRVVRAHVAEGYPEDIARAEALRPPAGDFYFARAIIATVLGLEAPASGEFDVHVRQAIREHKRQAAHGQSGLSHAVAEIWRTRDRLFDGYRVLETDEDRLAFLGGLPFVDEAAAWRVAQAFGIPRTRAGGHLATIAAVLGEEPGAFCRRLARESGESPAVVDAVLWRAVERGLINMGNLRMRARGTAFGARLFRSAQDEAAIYGADDEFEAAGVVSPSG